jgi:hypothetical protein
LLLPSLSSPGSLVVGINASTSLSIPFAFNFVQFHLFLCSTLDLSFCIANLIKRFSFKHVII